jgi:hypothetical protein
MRDNEPGVHCEAPSFFVGRYIIQRDRNEMIGF